MKAKSDFLMEYKLRYQLYLKRLKLSSMSGGESELAG